jgi:hypothetical protein
MVIFRALELDELEYPPGLRFRWGRWTPSEASQNTVGAGSLKKKDRGRW